MKGAGKLATRLPIAAGLFFAGLLVLGLVPLALVVYYVSLELAVLVAVLAAIPLLVQAPFALALPMQKASLLTFLERCGPDTEILSCSPFTLLSYYLKVRTKVDGVEHQFYIGYRPFGFRKPGYWMLVWPTTRKGISYQNRVRFNNFSAKFNTMEFTYVRNSHVRLFTYPMAGDNWWFDLYLFRGLNASPDHMWECYQIGLETKEKLTRENPAF